YKQWNLKLDETDFVFQYKLKKQITYGRIKTIMNHVNSYLYTEYNVNLDEFTTHYFRHTFGTLAIHSNMSLVDIQKIGGWANPQTLLKVYAHTNDEMMSNEINKLDISLG
ncbi:MAG: tyrosine-type recombinase/integrase, partial [Hominilimicola sp.]